MDRFWEGFGSENGAMLAPQIDPNMDAILEWPIPQNTHETQYIFEYFEVGRGRSWRQNWAQDGSKNSLPNNMHVNIEFFRLWVDFEALLGPGNRSKNGQKAISKSIQKGLLPRGVWMVPKGRDTHRQCHNVATTKSPRSNFWPQDGPGGGICEREL